MPSRPISKSKSIQGNTDLTLLAPINPGVVDSVPPCTYANRLRTALPDAADATGDVEGVRADSSPHRRGRPHPLHSLVSPGDPRGRRGRSCSRSRSTAAGSRTCGSCGRLGLLLDLMLCNCDRLRHGVRAQLSGIRGLGAPDAGRHRAFLQRGAPDRRRSPVPAAGRGAAGGQAKPDLAAAQLGPPGLRNRSGIRRSEPRPRGPAHPRSPPRALWARRHVFAAEPDGRRRDPAPCGAVRCSATSATRRRGSPRQPGARVVREAARLVRAGSRCRAARVSARSSRSPPGTYREASSTATTPRIPRSS